MTMDVVPNEKKLKEEIQLTMLEWMATLVARKAVPMLLLGITPTGTTEFVCSEAIEHEDLIALCERTLEIVRREDYRTRFHDQPCRGARRWRAALGGSRRQVARQPRPRPDVTIMHAITI